MKKNYESEPLKLFNIEQPNLKIKNMNLRLKNFTKKDYEFSNFNPKSFRTQNN